LGLSYTVLKLWNYQGNPPASNYREMPVIEKISPQNAKIIIGHYPLYLLKANGSAEP
jgi:hypothetical protein